VNEYAGVSEFVSVTCMCCVQANAFVLCLDACACVFRVNNCVRLMVTCRY
jgi:hypothetical protein